MADRTILGLPSASEINTSDTIAIVQGGVTKKALKSLEPISVLQQAALDLKKSLADDWTDYYVTGSDATNATATLADITGLVTGALLNSTKYLIEAVLDCAVSADANGNKYAISAGGTGSAAVVQVLATANGLAGAVASFSFNAPDTANANALMTSSGQMGGVRLVGFITTRSTGTATISLQHLHVTSGTSTVKVGSILRIKKAKVTP